MTLRLWISLWGMGGVCSAESTVFILLDLSLSICISIYKFEGLSPIEVMVSRFV